MYLPVIRVSYSTYFSIFKSQKCSIASLDSYYNYLIDYIINYIIDNTIGFIIITKLLLGPGDIENNEDSLWTT